MKCHNCGSSDEHERFCKQCGQVLREEPDIIDAQSRAESDTMTDAEHIGNTGESLARGHIDDPRNDEGRIYQASEENQEISDHLANGGHSETLDNFQDGSNSEANNLPPDYVYDRNDTVWIVILSIFVAIIIFLAILDEFIE